MPSDSIDWTDLPENRRFHSSSPIPYPYTLVTASVGGDSPVDSTLPPDFFEAETPHSVDTDNEPHPSISDTPQNQLRLKREDMRQPTWKVYEATCRSNVHVTSRFDAENGNTLDVRRSEHSSSVSGYIVTECSHLGDLQQVRVYTPNPEAVSNQQDSCPFIESANNLKQLWKTDNNGTLSMLAVLLKPPSLEGTEYELGETHVYPWGVTVLRPCRPNTMPVDWRPRPRTYTEDPPPIPINRYMTPILPSHFQQSSKRLCATRCFYQSYLFPPLFLYSVCTS